MIWFFLAGYVSGAVGMILYAGWWMRRNAKRVTPEEAIHDIEELLKEENKDERI